MKRALSICLVMLALLVTTAPSYAQDAFSISVGSGRCGTNWGVSYSNGFYPGMYPGGFNNGYYPGMYPGGFNNGYYPGMYPGGFNYPGYNQIYCPPQPCPPRRRNCR